MTKSETRAACVRMGLPVAGKGESFEICFIPDNDYTRFLKERVSDLHSRVGGGALVRDGAIVGSHRGYPFYTIGQRKGLGVAVGEPLYVTGIDPRRNEVEVGTEDKLYHSSLTAGSVNMVKYAASDTPRRVHASIRYKDGGSPATVRTLPDGRIRVDFEERRRAITPGQSVVLYEGDDLVGGGIIETVADSSRDEAASPRQESRS